MRWQRQWFRLREVGAQVGGRKVVRWDLHIKGRNTCMRLGQRWTYVVLEEYRLERRKIKERGDYCCIERKWYKRQTCNEGCPFVHLSIQFYFKRAWGQSIVNHVFLTNDAFMKCERSSSTYFSFIWVEKNWLDVTRFKCAHQLMLGGEACSWSA